MISFYVLNKYKSNSPWFWLTQDRISINDIPNTNNLTASTEGSFISHRHSTETTKMGQLKTKTYFIIAILASYMISKLYLNPGY